MSQFGLKGYYTIKKYKAATKELVQQVGPFENLITDSGLNRLGTSGANSYTYVGSGSTPPTVLDTSMQGFLYASSTTQGSITTNRTTSSPYWVEQSITRRFNPQGINYTVAEVGVGWTANGVGGIFSRALVVDGVGNPTTISVLADEYLDVTYTLRVYPPLGDLNYDAVISGITYSFSSRISNVTSVLLRLTEGMAVPSSNISCYNGASISLGPITGSLVTPGSSSSLTGCSAVTYVPDSLVKAGVSTSGLNIGNLPSGIKGLLMSTGSGGGTLQFSTQVVIDKYIPKDGTKSLTLNMSYSWGRYTP